MKQISIEQLQKIADYLVRQPYGEVAPLIVMITNLKDVETKEEIEPVGKE